MSCTVCIGVSDYDPPKFYRKELRTARTRHVCCECGGAIEPGQEYEHVRAKWGEDLEHLDTCNLCQEIRAVFSCGEGYVHHSLWEDMRESAFPFLTTGTDCFRELSAAAKSFVLERWRKWKFEQV